MFGLNNLGGVKIVWFCFLGRCQDGLVFSVTRRSRSDESHSLTYLLDVSIDFTDVTLVSDDTIEDFTDVILMTLVKVI